MAGAIQGKLIGVKVNGTYLRCQTDGTLTITTNTTDTDPCKPSEEEATNAASWVTHSIDSKAWTISATAKTFADVAAGVIDNSELANLMIVGTPSVEVTFQTIRTTDYDFDEIWVYEGTGTITSFTINAPGAGESTYDIEITGNGALTYTETPVTT